MAAPDGCRVCGVCEMVLRARRKEARYCSGKCRILACRQRRHTALLDRLVAAEVALAHATQAVAALREVANLGPHATGTLKVSGGRP